MGLSYFELFKTYQSFNETSISSIAKNLERKNVYNNYALLVDLSNQIDYDINSRPDISFKLPELGGPGDGDGSVVVRVTNSQVP